MGALALREAVNATCRYESEVRQPLVTGILQIVHVLEHMKIRKLNVQFSTIARVCHFAELVVVRFVRPYIVPC